MHLLQVVREASKRVLGLRPFDVQLIGGMILHKGQIAEMRTGEGKTLVAVLPAYLNALLGKGVQVSSGMNACNFTVVFNNLEAYLTPCRIRPLHHQLRRLFPMLESAFCLTSSQHTTAWSALFALLHCQHLVPMHNRTLQCPCA